MTLSVQLGKDALEVRARDLVHFDEGEAHLSIPYGAIRQVRAGTYAPPPGTFRLGNHDVSYADVRAGHFRRGDAWTFAFYDRPEQTVTLDLVDYDYALRTYDRVVLGADDPAALAAALTERSRGERASLAADDEVAWTALGPGVAVVASDGVRVGTVTHPLGDLEHDVFEGVAFRADAFGGARMARPEVIGRITAAEVRLTLTAAEARSLPPVALEDLREVSPGRGIFHHGPNWTRHSHWDDGA